MRLLRHLSPLYTPGRLERREFNDCPDERDKHHTTDENSSIQEQSNHLRFPTEHSSDIELAFVVRKNLGVRFTDDPLVENQSTFKQIARGKRTRLSKALAAMAEEILRNVVKQSVLRIVVSQPLGRRLRPLLFYIILIFVSITTASRLRTTTIYVSVKNIRSSHIRHVLCACRHLFPTMRTTIISQSKGLVKQGQHMRLHIRRGAIGLGQRPLPSNATYDSRGDLTVTGSNNPLCWSHHHGHPMSCQHPRTFNLPSRPT